MIVPVHFLVKPNIEWFVKLQEVFKFKNWSKSNLIQNDFCMNVNQSELYLSYVAFDELWPLSSESLDLRTETRIMKVCHTKAKLTICQLGYWCDYFAHGQSKQFIKIRNSGNAKRFSEYIVNCFVNLSEANDQCFPLYQMQTFQNLVQKRLNASQRSIWALINTPIIKRRR